MVIFNNMTETFLFHLRAATVTNEVVLLLLLSLKIYQLDYIILPPAGELQASEMRYFKQGVCLTRFIFY